MNRQRIPFITTEMYRQLPDQTTEILNSLITEVNSYKEDYIELANAILDIRKQIKDLPTPTPTPSGEWTQIMAFNVLNMGSVQGMCLQNTRLGFGIQSGTFPTARADMESQMQNGTLHAGVPPASIAVPIYYNNSLEAGHVAVWDHGVVYSDKVRYDSIDAVDRGYMGWGEFCDGVRVVEKSS